MSNKPCVVVSAAKSGNALRLQHAIFVSASLEIPIDATQLPEKLSCVWTAECWHILCALLHVLHELFFCCRDVNLNVGGLGLNTTRTPLAFNTSTPRFSVSLCLHFRQRLILRLAITNLRTYTDELGNICLRKTECKRGSNRKLAPARSYFTLSSKVVPGCAAAAATAPAASDEIASDSTALPLPSCASSEG